MTAVSTACPIIRSFPAGNDLWRIDFRLPDGEAIIRRALARESRLELLPRPDINIWIDRDYIMASLGVMSLQYPEAARKLARKSLSIPEGTPWKIHE